ncbi:MAG: aconitate hydratase, partial [Promethearchaeota archaeon]
TSIFPSDERTKDFLHLQHRDEQFVEIPGGTENDYDEIIEINLSDLIPLIAKPHSPGNVVPISEVEGIKVDQVAIGSCTNSSLKDMLTVAALLKEKKIHKDVSLGISPGSKQVLYHLDKSGALSDIISAGARILESACGPCIGMGFAPNTDAVSIRTFNRNFPGRSGTESAKVYLVSPESAVATALYGEITDPRKLGNYPDIEMPFALKIDDSMIIEPAEDPKSVEIERGPNIIPLPEIKPLSENLIIKVLIKVKDNITTDHILPAGVKILPFRSNLPKISEFVFNLIDSTFPTRSLEAKDEGGGVIIGGENYGQGSSREHAAMAPMYLGIKAIINKSFARIHRDNLINFGIIPLKFVKKNDYDRLLDNDILEFKDIKTALINNEKEINVKNRTQDYEFKVTHDLTEREREIIIAGGKLNYTKQIRLAKP